MKKRDIRWVMLAAIASMVGLFPVLESAARGDDGAQAALETKAGALEQMISGRGDASLKRFIDKHVSNALQQSLGVGKLTDRLKRIRSICARAGVMYFVPRGDGALRLTCGEGKGAHGIDFSVESKAPFKLDSLDVKKIIGTDEKVKIKPITWANLEQRLDEAETAGFSGAVVVVRDGKVVVDKGYGQADRERGIMNTSETVFGIASMAIDFTKAAILKLVDLGKLKTSDRVSKFLANVPEDKKSMTLDHLMKGRSGLPNYHHIPGQDEDYDLSWIDRKTAIERILAKELLFPVGKGNAHSHSAWVLLAAIVEIVSEEPYGEFLQNHFFRVVGMERTGLYEHVLNFPDDEIATAYGHSSVGTMNSPKYWGKSSWLGMGAGGMVSTPNDLYKWALGMKEGKTSFESRTAKIFVRRRSRW